MIDDRTLVILYGIKIRCLQKKAELQKAGAALEQSPMPLEPGKEDYIADVTPTLDQIFPKIEPKAGKSPVRQGGTRSISEILEEAERGNKCAVSNQISIEESISAAESAARVPKADLPGTENVPGPKPEEASEESLDAAGGERVGMADRIRAYLNAKAEWRVRKQDYDYQYALKKQHVKDLSFGLDFACAVIDDTIAALRTQKDEN